MASPCLWAVVGIGLFCSALMSRQTAAYEFTVGGSTGWSIPSDPNVNILNQWAERNRFQIADSIVFYYAPVDDSVLYVNQDDYHSCNNASPIMKYMDGHSVFQFNHSGPFYFISGNKDSCLKNEKLIVVVLANRSKKNISPSPPPSETSSTSPPSPSPSDKHAPSTSPPGTVEVIPTPAPTLAPAIKPRNSAGSLLVSLTGSVGALIALSLLLAP